MFVLDIDLFEIQPLANLSLRLRLRCVNAIFDVYFLFHWHKCNMYRVHTHNFLKFVHGKTVKIWNERIFRETIRFYRQTRRTVHIEITEDFKGFSFYREQMSENCEWIHLLFLGKTFRFDNFVILFYRIEISSLQRKVTVKVHFLSILCIVVYFLDFHFVPMKNLANKNQRMHFKLFDFLC